jgi:hypothetical protein
MHIRGLTVWCLLVGCAADAAAPKSDASVAADGGEATIERAVTEAVAAFDRVLAQNCRCVVEGGGVDKVDDCVRPAKSDPSWVTCGTSFLTERDSPETRVIARCLADEYAARDRCLSAAECFTDTMQECSRGAPRCLGIDPQLLVDLLEACPDLGLLSRLQPT